MHRYIRSYLERNGIEIKNSSRSIKRIDSNEVILDLKKSIKKMRLGGYYYHVPRGYHHVIINEKEGNAKINPIDIYKFSLDLAVENEDFEEAAKIRDMINKRETRSIERLLK
ncbi:UvrB/UvrC motif-containing protein [Candidatus Woesearchaeota archaeon]|nr:UvrB/UvrC motif-containing protein [Candidatus Woesearchaeota archaeon]